MICDQADLILAYKKLKAAPEGTALTHGILFVFLPTTATKTNWFALLKCECQDTAEDRPFGDPLPF